MQILDGKIVAKAHEEALKNQLEVLAAAGETVTMAIVLVGDARDSHMYADFMQKKAERMGLAVQRHSLPESATQEEVLAMMDALSKDSEVHGILPMMPMPKHIDADEVLQHLNPKKDIDGLTVHNIGLVTSGRDGFWPCTALACMAILKHYDIQIEGARVVVLGRSNVIGKPVAQLLLKEQGTVTICHSRTKDLPSVTKEADILVSAIGKAHYVTENMVKEGAVVIDVGINELDGKTVGDVDYENVSPKTSAITPVPGGVGSVTTTMMLASVLKAYEKNKEA